MVSIDSHSEIMYAKTHSPIGRYRKILRRCLRDKQNNDPSEGRHLTKYAHESYMKGRKSKEREQEKMRSVL